MYDGLLALTQSAISHAFFNTHLQVTSKNDKRTFHVGHAMGIVFSHPDILNVAALSNINFGVIV